MLLQGSAPAFLAPPASPRWRSATYIWRGARSTVIEHGSQCLERRYERATHVVRGRAACSRGALGAYHETELARLVDRVRDGLARYDAGEIHAFELDELICHYKRATQKLWSSCTGSGGQLETGARTLEWRREQDDLPDWWEQATSGRFRDRRQ